MLALVLLLSFAAATIFIGATAASDEEAEAEATAEEAETVEESTSSDSSNMHCNRDADAGNEQADDAASSFRLTTPSTTAVFPPPPPLLSPFGSYPNPLGLTAQDREAFFPVVKFPRQCWRWVKEDSSRTGSEHDDMATATTLISSKHHDSKKTTTTTKRRRKFVCKHADFTSKSDDRSTTVQKHLATEREFAMRRAANRDTWKSRMRRWLQSLPLAATLQYDKNRVYIGRYDEDRVGLYESDLFQQQTQQNGNNDSSSASNHHNDDDESFGCRSRTVHTGIDLDGRVGTPVFAFTSGTIHAVGYNPALGDYGNVIVVQHTLNTTGTTAITTTTTVEDHDRDQPMLQPRRQVVVVVYALYGHLDDASIRKKQVGDAVTAGQVLGWMGDVHQGGGWYQPHVHFQLALHPPTTHDLPGAVCRRDRPAALWAYPDPRHVLGDLY